MVFRRCLEDCSENIEMPQSHDTAQFLWVEGKLSKLEQLCLASFLYHGYTVHLYTYGEVSGVPAGVVQIPGHEILPANQIFLAPGVNGESYASFADFFRYELLAQRGGWWFDMDMVCLRRLPPPMHLTFASTWEGIYGEPASNCAIWCKPGDSQIIELSRRAKALVKTGNVSFGSLGPFLVQALVRERGLEAHIAPWHEFCPYPWRMVYRLALKTPFAYLKDRVRLIKHLAWQLVSPTFRAGYIRPNSRTLHLHNEIWKSSGLDKNERYFHLSPVERLKNRYLAGAQFSDA